MRIAITGRAGNGKPWLAGQLAASLGARHVGLEALQCEPKWESCGPDVLHERVAAATDGDGWMTEGKYHALIGDLVLERAETVVWLDLRVPVVMCPLVRCPRSRECPGIGEQFRSALRATRN